MQHQRVMISAICSADWSVKDTVSLVCVTSRSLINKVYRSPITSMTPYGVFLPTEPSYCLPSTQKVDKSRYWEPNKRIYRLYRQPFQPFPWVVRRFT